MIPYEAFGENVEAHLRYACFRPVAEALKILRGRLKDRSWERSSRAWITAFQQLYRKGKLTPAQIAGAELLRLALIERALSLDLEKSERTAHEVFTNLVEQWNKPMLTAPDLRRIADWFSKQARPGHASLAADILQAGYRLEDAPSEGSMWQALHPLAEWLILNGSAELRSGRRNHLALDIVHALHFFGAQLAQLLPSIRYVLLNEKPLEGYYNAKHDSFARFLSAVEHALSEGATESLAVDIVLAPKNRRLMQEIFDPVGEEPDYPTLRQVLIRALVKGAITGEQAAAGWKSAFWSQCPEEPLRFTTRDALEAALSALSAQVPHQVRPRAGSRMVTAPHMRGWTRFIASEAIRILGLSDAVKRRHPNDARLDRLASWPQATEVAWGVRDAVWAAVVDAADPVPFALARAILEESPEDPHAVQTAFLTLPAAPKIEVSAVRAPLLDRLRDELTRLINLPWTEPVFGILLPRLIGPATRIELVDLPEDCSVEIVSGVVRVDPRALTQATDLDWTEEERLAHGALYFFHEIVHRFQGIHVKAMVDPLHAAGAESTLLHVDLGADHAAARLVSNAVPRWSLTWLKDLQGRSLGNFPAGRFHTAAARARKAQRLVGVRLDFLARTSAPPLEVGLDQYVFADFGPAGGPFLVLLSGPPVSLLGAGELTQKEGAALSAAADAGRGERELEELDGILRAQLTKMKRR